MCSSNALNPVGRADGLSFDSMASSTASSLPPFPTTSISSFMPSVRVLAIMSDALDSKDSTSASSSDRPVDIAFDTSNRPLAFLNLDSCSRAASMSADPLIAFVPFLSERVSRADSASPGSVFNSSHSGMRPDTDRFLILE